MSLLIIVRWLETYLIRVPIMVILGCGMFFYEYYVVPDAEKVELSSSSPEVAITLLLFSCGMVLFGLAERAGLPKAHAFIWSHIHSGAESARRWAPRLVTLSTLKLLREIEDKSPFVLAAVVCSPLIIPGMCGWFLVLPMIKRKIWAPLFRESIPTFWQRLNARVYRPLDHTKPVIRLLHLCPGQHNDPIKCRLVESDACDAMFEAISYAWGGHLVLRRRISVNDFSFFVTENIAIALRHLRQPETSRVLWIDQLCINQLDEVEKTNQVTHKMHLVYRNATRVIAWLGAGGPNISWAFQRATKFPGEGFDELGPADQCPPKEDEDRDTWISTLIGYPLSWSLPASPDDSTDDEFSERENESLRRYKDVWLNIFWRKWFRRIWVIQETALAKNLIVKCGDAEMEWSILKRTASDLRTIHRVSPSSHAQALMDFAVGRMLDNDDLQQAELLELAIRFRKYEASDPRDKLIGLLGLARDGRQFSEVEYRFHDRSVFANFTVQCIQSTKSLAILSLAETRGTNEMMPEASMCSWTLNWASPSSDIYTPAVLWGTRLERSHLAEAAHYDACGGRPVICRREQGRPIPPLVRGIYLRGWHEDTIEAVSVTGSKWDQNMLTVLPIWAEFVQQQMRHCTGLSDSFERVITAEIIDSGLPELPWGGWYVPRDGSTVKRRDKDTPEVVCRASDILEDLCHGRRLFVTAKGRIGIGPSGSSIGDEVCVLYGSAVPLILRRWRDMSRLVPGGMFSRKPFDEGRPYCYVGQAVINGLMHTSSAEIEQRINEKRISVGDIWLR